MSGREASLLRVTRGVVWTVAVIAALVFAWALPGTIRFLAEAPAAFWAMALAALLVDVPLFGISSRQDLRVRSTLSVCFTFAIFVLWGAAPAIVVQAAAAALTVVGQNYHPQAGLYLTSRLIVATAAAELLVDLVEPRPVNTAGTGLNGGDLLAFALLAAVWVAVSYGLLAVARATVSPRGFRQATAEMRYDLASTAASVVVVSPLLTTITGWWPLLVAIPLMVWNGLARARIRNEQRLSREPVSGLLNRQGFAGGMRSLTALDTVAPEGPRPFGVVMVEIESVLTINRMFGRDIYERVVTTVSRHLTDLYGEDRVGRLSGEAIAILIPDLNEADAVTEARAVVAALGRTVEVDDIPFTLDPAGGVALSPLHGRELSTLLAKAELATREARRNSEPAMLYVRQATDVAERRVTLLRELRATLRDPSRREEVTLLYQPQVHLDSGRLAGVEALLRWTHPTWGPVPVDELLDAVEPTEVMHLLTRHVLDTVGRQMQRWNDEGEAVRVAVNISVPDLHEPDFPDELRTLLSTYGLEPSQLTIEITERMLITDAPRVMQACDILAGLGVGLSLDDFGTGYASLQQLRQLPLTEVKVDQSYVRGIVDDPTDAAIVAGVHALAQALDVDVVAEGVEDRRIAAPLSRLPGTIAQGWLFGKPMTPEALHEWRKTPARARRR